MENTQEKLQNRSKTFKKLESVEEYQTAAQIIIETLKDIKSTYLQIEDTLLDGEQNRL